MSRRGRVIAIDGPAGAGKSTVARTVAEKLDYTYIDTGAMYRAVARLVLQEGIDPARPGGDAAVARLAEAADIALRPAPGGSRVEVDGEDVTASLREPAVSEAVSYVAANPAVRARLAALQRDMARRGGVVMDGRDIGTVVLPFADVKIFLTASTEERARRRFAEAVEAGYKLSLDEVRRNIEQRDAIDSTRAVAPLRKAEDAVEIDSTSKTVEEVVEEILHLVRSEEDSSCTE